jgi:hypothetical protein
MSTSISKLMDPVVFEAIVSYNVIVGTTYNRSVLAMLYSLHVAANVPLILDANLNVPLTNAYRMNSTYLYVEYGRDRPKPSSPLSVSRHVF